MRFCPDCQALIPESATTHEALECAECGREAPLRGFPDDPLLGTTLLGRYRLEARLGEGGMAVVYRARDRSGALLAVKVLHCHLCASEDMVRRFRREARAAACLKGPHAVRVHESGELADGSLFIAMELVQGESLSKRLLRAGWFDAAEGLELLAQLAEGVAEAHAAGLVHRDIKPDNVVLEFLPTSPGFRARVLDFGIVKNLDPTNGTVGHTVTGRVFGTPEYMSPEQARGDADLDHRSDIFSLGVCAFVWWTGRLPWEGANPQAMMVARLAKDAPALNEMRPSRPLPAAVGALVAAMLARRADARMSTMETVALAARTAIRALDPAIPGVDSPPPTQAVFAATRPATPPRRPGLREDRLRRVGGYTLVAAGFLAAIWAMAWILRPG